MRITLDYGDRNISFTSLIPFYLIKLKFDKWIVIVVELTNNLKLNVIIFKPHFVLVTAYFYIGMEMRLG